MGNGPWRSSSSVPFRASSSLVGWKRGTSRFSFTNGELSFQVASSVIKKTSDSSKTLTFASPICLASSG